MLSPTRRLWSLELVRGILLSKRLSRKYSATVSLSPTSIRNTNLFFADGTTVELDRRETGNPITDTLGPPNAGLAGCECQVAPEWVRREAPVMGHFVAEEPRIRWHWESLYRYSTSTSRMPPPATPCSRWTQTEQQNTLSRARSAKLRTRCFPLHEFVIYRHLSDLMCLRHTQESTVVGATASQADTLLVD